MPIAIYHRVMRREGFEEVAKALMELVRDAQEKIPDEPRILYLDIDGHRDESGVFDDDMRELQQEFILDFLMQFLHTVHMPLMTASNPHIQKNEIPEELIFVNFKRDKETETDKLASLYIENYSNTEFMSEKIVYEYLNDVSIFIKSLNSTRPLCANKDNENPFEWRSYWHTYLVDLIEELFNGFILGNLITVSAMTRTLIESYAYICLFEKDNEDLLFRRWLISSLLSTTKTVPKQHKDELLALIQNHCESVNISYKEIKEDRRKGGDHAWLKPLFGKTRISFREICIHLNNQPMYEDYNRACAFVHGQDMTTKGSPFTFYSTIYGKLYMMMDYIFKVVELLIPSNEIMQVYKEKLQEKLYVLGAEYVFPRDSDSYSGKNIDTDITKSDSC